MFEVKCEPLVVFFDFKSSDLHLRPDSGPSHVTSGL